MLGRCIGDATLMQCTAAKDYVLKMAFLNSAAPPPDLCIGPIASAHGSLFS